MRIKKHVILLNFEDVATYDENDGYLLWEVDHPYYKVYDPEKNNETTVLADTAPDLIETILLDSAHFSDKEWSKLVGLYKASAKVAVLFEGELDLSELVPGLIKGTLFLSITKIFKYNNSINNLGR